MGEAKVGGAGSPELSGRLSLTKGQSGNNLAVLFLIKPRRRKERKGMCAKGEVVEDIL